MRSVDPKHPTGRHHMPPDQHRVQALSRPDLRRWLAAVAFDWLVICCGFVLARSVLDSPYYLLVPAFAAADRDYRSTSDYSQVHDDYFVRLDEFPISAVPLAVEVGLQQIIDPIYHHKPVGGREAWWAALPPFLRLVIATYDAADVLSYLRGEAALR